jgi:hypothetical protein
MSTIIDGELDYPDGENLQQAASRVKRVVSMIYTDTHRAVIGWYKNLSVVGVPLILVGLVAFFIFS